MVESHLLIGAKGVFGSAYITSNSEKVRILAISRENSQTFFGESSDISNLQTNIGKYLLEQQVTRVIFCAQHSNYRDTSLANVRKLYEVNDLLLLATLLSSGEYGCQFTYFSSGSVYAESYDNLDEESPIKDPYTANPYIASKIVAEYFASSIIDPDKLLVLRPFFMYGENQKTQTLIPGLIHKVKNGESVSLQGEFGLGFNPIYANDAAQMVYKLQTNSTTGVFNLSGSKQTSIKEICETIGNLTSQRPLFTLVSEIPTRIIGENSKIMRSVGDFSETDLEESLRLLI